MPFSLDPQPGENEIECGRCGAVIYDQLSRCPNCGVNLYEPEDEEFLSQFEMEESYGWDWLQKLRSWIREIIRKPYSAEEVFGDSLDQAFYFNQLLQKVGGDHEVIERLIEHERSLNPSGTRFTWLRDAIQRWERDNRASSENDRLD